MDARRGPGSQVRRLTRFRWPVAVLAIAAIGIPAGFAFAESGGPSESSTEPSGSPADWSQADWIAHDPALDPAVWENAEFVRIDCSQIKPPPGATADPNAYCDQAEGFPKLDPNAPDPWPERKLWCEGAPPGLSAEDPWCDANPIPASYPADRKAELEAYRVDRAFGEGQPLSTAGGHKG